ncbi:hypothetical protein ADU80_09570 [Clostridium botulinum]|uniref:Uncharacterized protein n=1 Tax=Clostridium botulinum TaxID=1491 RepID=A0A9Q1UVX8_CLOBO|nr:hypothetical protein [Clostridium botulinum]AEB77667.1 hypothetical protein CbC4_8003 [Clostridium botulinum BKT015925]KEH95750.1 hypothetical protein Y848_p0182 [Clostridium botulinum C/D str. Sp77]KOA75908.1 hypothetical protein ADU77_10350 [Clostridium botulinum]KOA82808.1 hypothetical protein ADU74_13055 [Clostridium botulinum]KOA84490.1 hypothetical protein ADU80_09570 [Clostridium botulinum]
MFKNKKVLIIFTLITFLVCLCVVIYVSGRKDVPKLTVSYNEKNIQIGQGGYRWKSRGKFKEHSIDSYASILSKLSPGMKVSPNGQLKLNFDYQPKTITLGGGNTTDGKVINDNVINISDYGTGVYFLDCTWEEGNVTYVIYVDIHH